MFSKQDVPYSTAFTETVYATGADNNPVTVKAAIDASTRIHITKIILSASANIQPWLTDSDDAWLLRPLYMSTNQTVEIEFDKEMPLTVTANKAVILTTNTSSAITITIAGYTD